MTFFERYPSLPCSILFYEPSPFPPLTIFVLMLLLFYKRTFDAPLFITHLYPPPKKPFNAGTFSSTWNCLYVRTAPDISENVTGRKVDCHWWGGRWSWLEGITTAELEKPDHLLHKHERDTSLLEDVGTRARKYWESRGSCWGCCNRIRDRM